METIKIFGSEANWTVIFTVKEWERFKRLGDKQLYKKYNKYADFQELRLSFYNDRKTDIELEAHIIKER